MLIFFPVAATSPVMKTLMGNLPSDPMGVEEDSSSPRMFPSSSRSLLCRSNTRRNSTLEAPPVSLLCPLLLCISSFSCCLNMPSLPSSSPSPSSVSVSRIWQRSQSITVRKEDRIARMVGSMRPCMQRIHTLLGKK